MKIWGRAEIVENDPDLLAKVSDPGYKARPERALVFHVDAWDINCRQHIQERYTLEEMQDILRPLEQRIVQLEAEAAALKARKPEGGVST